MSESNPTPTDPRAARGLSIADRFRIKRDGNVWIVPSESATNTKYRVDPSAGTCTCPDHVVRGTKCKHQWAVEYTVISETTITTDGKNVRTVTRTVKRVTYRQNWPMYNAAQTHENERFLELLRDLCAGIEQPPQRKGRPRLPLADVVFALAVKSYSTMSGRRATSFIRDAEARGLIDCTPHYNSGFRYLESPEMTPLLKGLIEETAKPLKAVEIDFAVDSTGFATTTYHRWFDHKWGKERAKASWVKCHIITGVKTNIVTSVEATPTESADAPQLPQLVGATAKTFDIHEVSGDKAYSSRRNLHAVETVGGTAYIPFKERTTGMGHTRDSLWSKMWAYYTFRREDFLTHYHRRSNVETTMHMIKSKFGASVRAKTPDAQVNEVLLKVLCHNIVVLVQSIYELNLEPVFWTFEAENAVAPIFVPKRLF